MEQVLQQIASTVQYQDESGERQSVLKLLYEIPSVAALQFRMLDEEERLLVAQAVQRFGLLQLEQEEAGTGVRDVAVEPGAYLAQGLSDRQVARLTKAGVLQYNAKTKLELEPQFARGFDEFCCHSRPLFCNCACIGGRFKALGPAELPGVPSAFLAREVARADPGRAAALAALQSDSPAFAFGRVAAALVRLYGGDGAGVPAETRWTLEALDLTRDNRALVQKFVLGDHFVQAKLVVERLAAALAGGGLRLQELGERLGLGPAAGGAGRLEGLLQAQFLLQLVAMPLGCSVLLPEAAAKHYRVQLAALERLGLLRATRAADLSLAAFRACFGAQLDGPAAQRFPQAACLVLTFSDAFQLLQFAPAEQLNHQKVYRVSTARPRGRLYVESTGRVSYLRAGRPEEDEYYEVLLGMFCDVVYDLPNMLVCQLSEQQVRSSGVQASLVARFLVKNSSAPVPVDLINLLDSWENKGLFGDRGPVCVFEFETRLNDKSPTPVLDLMLYHELCVDAHEFLLWYDSDFVRRSNAAARLIIRVINRQQEPSQKSRALVRELYDLLAGRPDKLLAVVKQDYVGKLEEKIRSIAEQYGRPQVQELFKQWESAK